MSGWIKLEKDLLLDPRVRRMARRLGEIDCNAPALQAVTLVIGALSILWLHADAHVRPDDTLDLGAYDIDQLVGIAGFSQICPDDWLQIIDADSVKLPGFHKHNGTEAKKKAMTQKRVAKHRNASALHSGNASVTPAALPDQDQDQDQTKTLRTPTARKRAKRLTVVNGIVEDPEWFKEFKSTYPHRAGDQGWRKALRAAHARLAEGHTTKEFIEGAQRYAIYVRVAAKESTEFVKQAATFLGPDKPFLETYRPSQAPESAMERIRRLNSGDDTTRTYENEIPVALDHTR